VIREK